MRKLLIAFIAFVPSIEVPAQIRIARVPSTIYGLVELIIYWLLYFAGVLAFIFLIYSGILYITASGDPEQAKKGQRGLINAVIGIIIIVLSFAIFKAAVNFALPGVRQ